MKASVLAAAVLLMTQQAGQASPPSNSSPLIVHEWGTFISVQGSDGKTVGGMVDSDEALPGFVEERSFRSFQRASFGQKMETPVTYFYTDRPRDIRVRVDMPAGLLTHWYPGVRAYGPDPRIKVSKPEKSYLNWGKISLIPPTPENPATLATAGKDLSWGFARQTDSALIKARVWDEVRNEKGSTGVQEFAQFEKFLFYRGLGTFTLPLNVQSTENGQSGTTLALANAAAGHLAGLFIVRVNNGAIQFRELQDLEGHARRDVAATTLLPPGRPLAEGVPAAKSAVAKALVGAGLYAKEAQAMVNTWEKSYFRTEGLRVLYILPRAIVDGVIPIHIDPAPESLVRVMVGRVEVLTPAKERQIAAFVAALGSPDFHARDTASRSLANLGRLTEPALRRVLATTTDPEVKSRAQSLIGRLAVGN